MGPPPPPRTPGERLGRDPRRRVRDPVLAALDARAPEAAPAAGRRPPPAAAGRGAARWVGAARAHPHPHRTVSRGPGGPHSPTDSEGAGAGGAAGGVGGARGVRRFVGKPSPARAALLRQRGALWNTGLFAWGVARFLGEAGAYARELKPGWPALAAGDVAGFFGAVRPVAVDVAVLERT